MCNHAQHNPIFCILPPYILDSIVKNGSAEQRRAALETLMVDQTFRAMRAAAPSPAASTRRRKSATAGTPQKQRTIHSAQNQQMLPGVIVRSEGSPASGDIVVNEAYDGLGATYDFYAQIFDRDSIDDEGLPMVATVHYDRGYNNAFWNGAQMVFGDGDGRLFNRFTASLDVIGHELAHGVTEDESGLVYLFQPGALNEHFSDVFGSLIKQYHLQQSAAQADWLIGAELLAPGIQGVALRSMSAPGTAFDDPVLGKDPQPAHMKNFVRTYQDNGGVHINSGIPNHAFYLIATNLGGFAWEKAGHIWYETLRDSAMRSNTGFKRFARLTHNTAKRLYGNNSVEAAAVVDGWKSVGIKVA